MIRTFFIISGLSSRMELDRIVDTVRNFPGVKRKNTIQDIIQFLPTHDYPTILASSGEDAAVISHGDDCLLFAADGIMESLMKSNPYFAGYYSVLVNVNDIAAMGGKPLAMVDIISIKEQHICSQVLKGMERAVRKFGVPVVGGHTHPDCEYHAIDVAILGIVPKTDVIYSHTAQEGDDIIFVMDIVGHYPPDLQFAWDTTSQKEDSLVQAQFRAMQIIAKEKLVHSGKDMSNPGCLGTLGMLLETSCMGATVDLDKIPRPENVDFIRWLLSYQGCGFTLTCDPRHSQRILEIFRNVEVDGAVVGKVDSGYKFNICMGGETRVLFDFARDIITGCRPKLKK